MPRTARAVMAGPEQAERVFTGNIPLRIPPMLHRRLMEQAAEQGVSLNQWLTTLLAMHVPPDLDGPAQQRRPAGH